VSQISSIITDPASANMITAVSTSIYTLFTLILVIINLRAIHLTRKILANNRRPVLASKVIQDDSNSIFMYINNDSIFIANDINVKVTIYKSNSIIHRFWGKKVKSEYISSLEPGSNSRFFIGKNEDIAMYFNIIKCNIKFSNENYDKFCLYYKLVLPI